MLLETIESSASMRNQRTARDWNGGDHLCVVQVIASFGCAKTRLSERWKIFLSLLLLFCLATTASGKSADSCQENLQLISQQIKQLLDSPIALGSSAFLTQELALKQLLDETICDSISEIESVIKNNQYFGRGPLLSPGGTVKLADDFEPSNGFYFRNKTNRISFSWSKKTRRFGSGGLYIKHLKVVGD